MISKPLLLSINETYSGLLQICNKADIHPSILKLIVKNLLSDIEKVERQEFSKEKVAYENYLKDSLNKEDDSKSDQPTSEK